MSTNKLDDLLLLEKLAAGGMAEVYRAVQQGYGGFEKIVAVKRILPHFASDEEFKNMFVMEANLSGLLQHPNVVQIFSNGESEGYLYLVMEFVDGRNMRQLLARADKLKIRIPIEFACYMIAEAAKGLDYAHTFVDQKTGQGMEIVHRDMSPQNIMLSYDGAIKIVDFGIAKAAARSEHTRAGVLKGKFGYMSPEQAQGMPIDRRTDIFALGIIFFELLTQRRLFSHDDDMRTLQLIRECNVPRPSKYNPSISPALDRIVLKALAKNRNDRYASSSEFYADLQRFLNQKYPQFLPMEFSKFLREKLFVEDIANDKKKREILAAEAPAQLGSPGVARRAAQAQNKSGESDKKDKDQTQVDFEDEFSEATQVSGLVSLESPELQNSIELSVESSNSVDSPSIEVAQPVESKSDVMDSTRIMSANEKSAIQLNESDANAAFPMGAGPSHLSLSLQSGNELPAPIAQRAAIANNTVKISQKPTLEERDSSPQVRVGSKVVTFADKDSPPKLFSNRAYFMIMVAAALGAYSHFSNKPVSLNSVQANLESVKKLVPDQLTTDTAVNTESPTPTESQRAPASSVDDSNYYKAEGATGYISVQSIPSANKVYVDGKLLVDANGREPASLKKVQKLNVGKRRIRLENTALGLSWEEDVEIEFDTVKKLDIHLK